jgi:hypothetical protein
MGDGREQGEAQPNRAAFAGRVCLEEKALDVPAPIVAQPSHCVGRAHACVQPARCRLRQRLVYGSTNKYRPVNMSRRSGISARRPTQAAYFCIATATPFMMKPAVKAMDNQRWVCRTHVFRVFQFIGTSS